MGIIIFVLYETASDKGCENYFVSCANVVLFLCVTAVMLLVAYLLAT